MIVLEQKHENERTNEPKGSVGKRREADRIGGYQ
jgi:hypothetical protein